MNEMGKKEHIKKRIRQFKVELSKSMPIEKVIFFGSAASGKFRKDSDIDLIIVSKKFQKVVSFKRPLGFYKYWKLDYSVDFLCYTPKEFKELSKKVLIVREAIKEGIEIK
jgi:predicted nucleotidyltransferase